MATKSHREALDHEDYVAKILTDLHFVWNRLFSAWHMEDDPVRHKILMEVMDLVGKGISRLYERSQTAED